MEGLLLKGYRVSILQDEKSSVDECGDGSIKMWIHFNVTELDIPFFLAFNNLLFVIYKSSDGKWELEYWKS